MLGEITHKHPLNYIARIAMTNKEVNNKGELIYQHTQFWNKSMTVFQEQLSTQRLPAADMDGQAFHRVVVQRCRA